MTTNVFGAPRQGHFEQAQRMIGSDDTEDDLADIDNNPPLGDDDTQLAPHQAWCLYASHFLSMWNSRAYEYSAILFIQHTFPGDLLPSSINGIAETVCVLMSTAALGNLVDNAPNRLKPLILSILSNRITLVACCMLWLLMFHVPSKSFQISVFAVLLILGMVEKVSRMTNVLSMERDWIPIIADGATYGDTGKARASYSLTHLNTVMRRIDITCKFLAPLAASALAAMLSLSLVATIIAITSFISAFCEIAGILHVWKTNNKIKTPKESETRLDALESPGQDIHTASLDGYPALLRLFLKALRGSMWTVNKWVQMHTQAIIFYFSTHVWQPSICVAIMHASVLAWSGTLITWLLNSGYTMNEVTVAKSVGLFFEIGSTFLYPWGVYLFSSSTSASADRGMYEMLAKHETETDETAEERSESLELQNTHQIKGVVKTGQWGMGGLMIALVPTVAALFMLDKAIEELATPVGTDPQSPMTTSRAASTMFFAFLSVSFLGRWTYDLASTQLTQVLVPVASRSGFGGTEMAIVSSISLVHWVAAAVWHRQEDFKWLAVGSMAGVFAATCLFMWWASRWKRSPVHK